MNLEEQRKRRCRDQCNIGLGDNVLMREMNGSPPSPLWGHIQDPEEEKEDEDDDYDEDDEDRVRGRFLWHILLLQHQASPREVSPCRRLRTNTAAVTTTTTITTNARTQWPACLKTLDFPEFFQQAA